LVHERSCIPVTAAAAAWLAAVGHCCEASSDEKKKRRRVLHTHEARCTADACEPSSR